MDQCHLLVLPIDGHCPLDVSVKNSETLFDNKLISSSGSLSVSKKSAGDVHISMEIDDA